MPIDSTSTAAHLAQDGFAREIARSYLAEHPNAFGPPAEDEPSDPFDAHPDALHASKNLLMGALMARNGREFLVAVTGALAPIGVRAGTVMLARSISEATPAILSTLSDSVVTAAEQMGIKGEALDSVREAFGRASQAAAPTQGAGPYPPFTGPGSSSRVGGTCVACAPERDADGVAVAHVSGFTTAHDDRVEVEFYLSGADPSTIAVRTDNIGTTVTATFSRRALYERAMAAQRAAGVTSTAYAGPPEDLGRYRAVVAFHGFATGAWNASRETLTLTFHRDDSTSVPVQVTGVIPTKPASTPIPGPTAVQNVVPTIYPTNTVAAATEVPVPPPAEPLTPVA